MFSIKFLIAYIIPDIPADVKMALSKVCGESSVTHFSDSRGNLQKIKTGLKGSSLRFVHLEEFSKCLSFVIRGDRLHP